MTVSQCFSSSYVPAARPVPALLARPCYPVPGAMSDSAETQDLVVRAQRGDVAAREALFERSVAPVLAVVRRRMGRRLRLRMESVDVAQSALGDALRDLDQFEGRSDRALMRWLARIVENKLKKAARAQDYGDRDAGRVRPIEPANSEGPGCEPSAAGPGAATVALQGEQRDRLRAALARLPERERRLVELRDFEALAWEQVARQADEPTVKAAQHCYARARARLASMLSRDQAAD